MQIIKGLIPANADTSIEKRYRSALLIGLCVLGLSACSSTQNTPSGSGAQAALAADARVQDAQIQANTTDVADSSAAENKLDPFEGFNRLMWDFNYDVLDKFIVKPLTKGYVAVMPEVLRYGLRNASDNLEEPANVANNLLQGKGGASASSAGRFLLNSTVGILGLFDVAEKMGLPKEEEDFGQVLGVWGAGTGPYLMLPALGPSDARSLTGRVVDNIYWPLTVLESQYVVTRNVVKVLEARASLLEQEENLNRALDPYLFVRDAYFQRLAFEVSDGKIQPKSQAELDAEQDDFSDFEDMFK